MVRILFKTLPSRKSPSLVDFTHNLMKLAAYIGTMDEGLLASRNYVTV